MRFNPAEIETLNSNGSRFTVGDYYVHITDVVPSQSQKGNEQFVLTLTGLDGQTQKSWLTFGLDFTEAQFQRILGSIQSAGTVIPDIDYGYNTESVKFLKGKACYIRILPDRNEENAAKGWVRLGAFLLKEDLGDSFQTPQQTQRPTINAQQAQQRKAFANDPFGKQASKQANAYQSDPFANAKPMNIEDSDLPF